MLSDKGQSSVLKKELELLKSESDLLNDQVTKMNEETSKIVEMTKALKDKTRKVMIERKRANIERESRLSADIQAISTKYKQLIQEAKKNNMQRKEQIKDELMSQVKQISDAVQTHRQSCEVIFGETSQYMTFVLQRIAAESRDVIASPELVKMIQLDGHLSELKESLPDFRFMSSFEKQPTLSISKLNELHINLDLNKSMSEEYQNASTQSQSNEYIIVPENLISLFMKYH